MHDKISDVTGIILVGGKSRRMGQDKAFLLFAGRPLFERVLTVFRRCFSEVLLVGDRKERFEGYDLQVIPDMAAGGALGGLYTGLVSATTDCIFVSSCDLPFPSEEVVRHLCSLRGDYDAVVVDAPHGYEPLFALYRKTCLAAMESLLAEGNFRVFDLYPRLNVCLVSHDEFRSNPYGRGCFRNINTPAEYADAGKESDRAT